MKFDYQEIDGITEAFAETDDMCVMCKLFDYCPMILAIESHLVYPAADKLTITDCPIYAADEDK